MYFLNYSSLSKKFLNVTQNNKFNLIHLQLSVLLQSIRGIQTHLVKIKKYIHFRFKFRLTYCLQIKKGKKIKLIKVFHCSSLFM